MTNPC